jgi:hypothetical protein
LTKHTILLLAANPLGTDWLALDEEARAIQEELERSVSLDVALLIYVRCADYGGQAAPCSRLPDWALRPVMERADDFH